MDIEFELPTADVLGSRTNVPLVYARLRVDVAVTVTVDSELARVLLLPAADDDAVRALASVSVDVDDAREVAVMSGVEVITDRESSVSVAATEESIVVATSTAGIVSVPNEDTETRTSLVAAATTVASRVVEPTSTFTSTTLDVTVASGTRGRRW